MQKSRKSRKILPAKVSATKVCRKKIGSGYESWQQRVTVSGAETLLNYADKNDDESGKVKLASLSVSNVMAKEFKYYRTCYQILTQAAAVSFSATMDNTNKKLRK